MDRPTVGALAFRCAMAQAFRDALRVMPLGLELGGQRVAVDIRADKLAGARKRLPAGPLDSRTQGLGGVGHRHRARFGQGMQVTRFHRVQAHEQLPLWLAGIAGELRASDAQQ